RTPSRPRSRQAPDRLPPPGRVTICARSGGTTDVLPPRYLFTMTLTLPLDTPVPADEVWSVSQVTSAVRKLIDRGVSTVWVRGEVLQCKAWSSGHWYFTLRDD